MSEAPAARAPSPFIDGATLPCVISCLEKSKHAAKALFRALTGVAPPPARLVDAAPAACLSRMRYTREGVNYALTWRVRGTTYLGIRTDDRPLDLKDCRCRYTEGSQPRDFRAVPAVLCAVFDVNSKDAFEELQKTRTDQDHLQCAPARRPVLVIAVNIKGKPAADWKVSSWQAYDWATQNGYHYIEVNPKEDSSINELCATVLDLALEDTRWRQMRFTTTLIQSDTEGYVHSMTPSELAQRVVAPPPPRGSSWVRFYQVVFTFLYEFFTVALSVIDMITDIAVVVYFWQQGHTTFFGLSLTFLIYAYIGYVMIFTMRHKLSQLEAERKSSCKCMILSFLFGLVFAPFVPVFLYVIERRVPALENFWKIFGITYEERVNCNPTHDPLRNFISTKFASHLGFLYEAGNEAIPQAIIQFIAILVTRQESALLVFSVTVSLITICSKVLRVSYSIHRPSAAFNVCCLLADIFCLFGTAAWLAFPFPAESSDIHFFVFKSPINAIVGIWCYKILLLSCFAALFLIHAYGWYVNVVNCCKCHKDKPRAEADEIANVCAAPFYVTVMFPLYMLMVEAFKLSIVPVLLLGDYSTHGKAYELYSWVFKFLRDAQSQEELRERLYCVNHVIARQRKRKPFKPKPESDTYLEATSVEAFTLQDLATKRKLTVASWFKSAFRGNGVFVAHLNVFLGIWILSNFLSLLFPIACLFSLGSSVPAALQRTLSSIFVIIFIFLLILAPSVYRFQRLRFHLLPAENAHVAWIQTVAMFHDILQQRKRLLAKLGGVPREGTSPALQLSWPKECAATYSVAPNTTAAAFNEDMCARAATSKDPIPKPKKPMTARAQVKLHNAVVAATEASFGGGVRPAPTLDERSGGAKGTADGTGKGKGKGKGKHKEKHKDKATATTGSLREGGRADGKHKGKGKGKGKEKRKEKAKDKDGFDNVQARATAMDLPTMESSDADMILDSDQDDRWGQRDGDENANVNIKKPLDSNGGGAGDVFLSLSDSVEDSDHALTGAAPAGGAGEGGKVRASAGSGGAGAGTRPTEGERRGESSSFSSEM